MQGVLWEVLRIIRSSPYLAKTYSLVGSIKQADGKHLNNGR